MAQAVDGKPFEWPVRVYYEDTDLQGVVYFANYFKYMERARSEWLRALGIEQDRFLAEKRRYFVVVDTSAKFVSPARFNDCLVATARLTERSRATFLIEQNIYRKGELLCAGQTRAACVNADTGKPVAIPDLLFKDTIHVD